MPLVLSGGKGGNGGGGGTNSVRDSWAGGAVSGWAVSDDTSYKRAREKTGLHWGVVYEEKLRKRTRKEGNRVLETWVKRPEKTIQHRRLQEEKAEECSLHPH